jgi:hypothetical protein
LALGCNKSILCRFGWLITSHCKSEIGGSCAPASGGGWSANPLQECRLPPPPFPASSFEAFAAISLDCIVP